MTNRELLKTSKEKLGEVDRQRQFILQVELTPRPCPACHQPTDIVAAAGLDLDKYDVDGPRLEFRCPHCQSELEVVVPFFAVGPGWHWKLKDSWLQERLHKALEYERLARKEDKFESS
jgi:Zn finger protein HypA/HybF involved in hydrogenase expression